MQNKSLTGVLRLQLPIPFFFTIKFKVTPKIAFVWMCHLRVALHQQMELVASNYRSLLNENRVSISFLEREVCALGVSFFGFFWFFFFFCISFPLYTALPCYVYECVFMWLCVCVCVCVSVLYKYTFGSKSIAILPCKTGLWKAPSFLAETTENLE